VSPSKKQRAKTGQITDSLTNLIPIRARFSAYLQGQRQANLTFDK